MRSWMTLLVWCALVAGAVSCSGRGGGEEPMTIAVIPKGTTHLFWQSIHAGAIKASRELEVNIQWIGPEREDDRRLQITLVNNQVVSQVAGIVLAPLDAMALRRPVRAAVNQNIPVVIIDSDLHDFQDLYTSFVATDNRQGGRLAGENLARILNGQGKIILLRHAIGSASTENREEGFLEAIRTYPDIIVVSDEQYSGVTTAQAQQVSENLLIRFQDAQGQLMIDGIFCPNESSTYGMLQALKRQRLAGKVVFIGFDANDALIEGLRQGELNGLVVQDPFNMGYLGVKTMVLHLRGEQVEKRIDTGVTFIAREDLQRPEIMALIKPDVDKWLNLK